MRSIRKRGLWASHRIFPDIPKFRPGGSPAGSTYNGDMATPKLPIPPEFDTASKEQRIELVQELWDRIAQDPHTVLVPASHKQILDERLNAYRVDPESGRPWAEVRDELLTKLRDG